MRPPLLLLLLLAVLAALPADAACNRNGERGCRNECQATHVASVGTAVEQFETCLAGCIPGAEGKRCRLACREALLPALEYAEEADQICLDACGPAYGCPGDANPMALRGAAFAGAGDGAAVPVPRAADPECSASATATCRSECRTERETQNALFLEEHASCWNGCQEGKPGIECRAACREPLLREMAGSARAFESCRSGCESGGGCPSLLVTDTLAALTRRPVHAPHYGVQVRRKIPTQAKPAVAAADSGRTMGAAMRR